MRVNGQALGIALSAAIVATRLPVHLAELGRGVPTTAAHNEALVGAIHDAFAIAALICCFGVVASLIRGSSRPGHAAATVSADMAAASAPSPAASTLSGPTTR
jgi:hypothetical protein